MKHKQPRFNPAFWIMMCSLMMLGACAKVGTPPGYSGKKDVFPPSLSGISIIDCSHIRLTFDEPLNAESTRKKENFTISSKDGTELPVIDALFGRSGDEIIITTEKMTVGKEYFLEVLNVLDMAGNPIGKKNSVRFAGSGKPDDTKPSLLRTYPANSMKSVSISVCPLLSFNDCMNPESVSNAVVLEDDAGVSVPGKLVGENHAYHFIPDKPLLYQTVYTLKLDQQAKDVAGNPLYEEAEITFQTITDTEGINISGEVTDGTQGKASDMKVLLINTTRSDDPDATWFGISPVAEDKTFIINGISPILPEKMEYFLFVIGSLPESFDKEISAYGYYGADTETTAIIPPTAGTTVNGLNLDLELRDRRGPSMEECSIYPQAYARRNGIRLEASASQQSESKSGIKAVEFFLEHMGSNGTGTKLSPPHGKLGTGKNMRVAGDFPTILKDYDKQSLDVYIHAQNTDGYWGKATKLTVNRAPDPVNPLWLKGIVLFGEEPAAFPILRVSKAGETTPLFFGKGNKDGTFRVGPLASGEYWLFAYKDEARNNLDDDTDPSAWWTDEQGGRTIALNQNTPDLSINLGNRPSISEPLVRFYYYPAEGSNPAHATVYAYTQVSDSDYDLTKVEVIAPDGTRRALGDDGKDGDTTADDGIFTRVWELTGAEIPQEGSSQQYSVEAQDEMGNIVTVGANDFPALSVIVLSKPQAFNVTAEKEELKISWTPSDPPPAGGYLLFILPADKVNLFNGPGSGELYTNYPKPFHRETTLSLTLDDLGNYWSLPHGTKMVAILMSVADDADPGRADKTITKYYFNKP